MATVHITQDTEGRNFLPAKAYGELNLIMPSKAQVILTATPAIRRMRRELRDFSDDDFLLLSGDPAIMGIALAVAADINQGRVKILKWDRLEKTYYDVSINIHEKGESEDG